MSQLIQKYIRIKVYVSWIEVYVSWIKCNFLFFKNIFKLQTFTILCTIRTCLTIRQQRGYLTKIGRLCIYLFIYLEQGFGR